MSAGWILEKRALIQCDYTLTDQETADLLEVFDTVTPEFVESYPTIKLVPATGPTKLLKTPATNATARTLVLPPRPKTPPPPSSFRGSWPAWLALGIICVIGVCVVRRGSGG